MPHASSFGVKKETGDKGGVRSGTAALTASSWAVGVIVELPITVYFVCNSCWLNPVFLKQVVLALTCELVPASLKSYLRAIRIICLGEVLPIKTTPRCSHSAVRA